MLDTTEKVRARGGYTRKAIRDKSNENCMLDYERKDEEEEEKTRFWALGRSPLCGYFPAEIDTRICAAAAASACT